MDFSAKLNALVVAINGPLWNYILVFVLAIAGLYFTFGLRFAQFRYLFTGLKPLTEDHLELGQSGVTDYQAFSISLASRVGVGNITGIATAIAIGGPGAIFWMWVFAFLGMGIAFVECVLAQIYKQKDGDNFVGGAAYYIEKALGMRWLGIIFSILMAVTYGFIFNMLQAKEIATTLVAFDYQPNTVGIILAILTLFITFGGLKRIALFSGFIVPTMILFYLFIAGLIIILNITEVPAVIGTIFSSAFDGRAAAGGALGTVIMQGVRRGLFTSETGAGSSPSAAAVAHSSHPIKQGMVQSISIFMQTFLVCTCTAFVVIIGGLYSTHTLQGIDLFKSSLMEKIGPFATFFLTVSILLFAFSTIIGNHYFGESSIKFMRRGRGKKTVFTYRIVVAILLIVGCDVDFTLIWALSDLFMGGLMVINLYAIIRLFSKVKVALYDFEDQKAQGKNPVFYKETIQGLKTDAWESKHSVNSES